MKTRIPEHPGSMLRQRGSVPGAGGIFILLLACFFMLFGTGCQTAFPDQDTQEAENLAHPPYTLGPGDKIRVTVYGHEDLSGVFAVDDAGRISLPLIRGINVKGLTLPELEQHITQELLKNDIVNPRVSTDLVELRPFCVLGEVRNPGCFSYVYGMNTSKAIARAGGYTYRANETRFLITREDGRKVTANRNTPVFSGDTVEVLERLF
jgi:polysaccharide export outer membrane protein